MPRSVNPSAWCTTSVRTRTSSDSPVTASVKTRPPPTSMPAPVSASPPSCRSPTSTRGVRDTRPPTLKPPRALQRRPYPCHPSARRIQPARRAVHLLGGCAHPQRVGLECQRKPAGGPRADQLAPRAHRRHRHRHPRLQRPRSVRRQPERTRAVAGHAPDRDPVAELVAQPRVEPRHRRVDLAHATPAVATHPTAAPHREPDHQRAPRVVRPEHRRAQVALERERAFHATEVRPRAAAPHRDDTAILLPVQLELRVGEQVAARQHGAERSAARGVVHRRLLAGHAVAIVACRRAVVPRLDVPPTGRPSQR